VAVSTVEKKKGQKRRDIRRHNKGSAEEVRWSPVPLLLSRIPLLPLLALLSP